jgi:hypothetical protein
MCKADLNFLIGTLDAVCRKARKGLSPCTRPMSFFYEVYMKFIRIKNWDIFQHYKTRSPPWIKLYHSLLDDYEYGRMRDDSKLLLLSLFMLASKTNNRTPNDMEWIQRKTMITAVIDLGELIENRFIYLSDSINGE